MARSAPIFWFIPYGLKFPVREKEIPSGTLSTCASLLHPVIRKIPAAIIKENLNKFNRNRQNLITNFKN
jgi:hypothetical protein